MFKVSPAKCKLAEPVAVAAALIITAVVFGTLTTVVPAGIVLATLDDTIIPGVINAVLLGAVNVSVVLLFIVPTLATNTGIAPLEDT